ncbi:MAG: phosphatase PAP2-related protein [Candidatus Pacebacteria bacterium]|nr:phosphatase PAP2-related protein [Candidatus Paceibacterota bacterium]
MRKIFEGYEALFTKRWIRSFLVGLILFSLAIVFQFYASAYAVRVSSGYVNDIILDNIPAVNLNFIIVEGALAAIACSIFLLLAKPNYIIFTLKVVAIFIATRAVFIAATHSGIPPGQIDPDPTGFFDRIYTDLGLAGGFFFSGHTGLTFLLALVFWDERFWRYVYFAVSFLFGVSVLLAHVHYSIDVLAAPYIAYAIFKMAQYLFKEDYALLGQGSAVAGAAH